MTKLTTYRREAWREARREHRMHLADNIRLRMRKTIVHYFEEIYGYNRRPDRLGSYKPR